MVVKEMWRACETTSLIQVSWNLLPLGRSTQRGPLSGVAPPVEADEGFASWKPA